MDKIKIIKSETEELLKKMIDHFEIEVTQEGEVFQVMIKAEEEAPVVIGRYGETIRAIQKILEVIFYKKFASPVKLLVNVNDYREKQKEKLEAMAVQFATKTKETKNPAYLNNLSSYERKIIHEYVMSNYPDLISYSIGEGKERKLVIDLKKNESKKEASR